MSSPHNLLTSTRIVPSVSLLACVREGRLAVGKARHLIASSSPLSRGLRPPQLFEREPTHPPGRKRQSLDACSLPRSFLVFFERADRDHQQRKMLAALSSVHAACGAQVARPSAGRSAAAGPVGGATRVTARGSAFTGGSVRMSRVNNTRGRGGALTGAEEEEQQRVVPLPKALWFFPPLLHAPAAVAPLLAPTSCAVPRSHASAGKRDEIEGSRRRAARRPSIVSPPEMGRSRGGRGASPVFKKENQKNQQKSKPKKSSPVPSSLSLLFRR